MPGRSYRKYVSEFIKPFPGCRILDIGCGPADILAFIPSENIGYYVGFDMNPNYVEAARRKWGERAEFRCQRVCAGFEEPGSFDIVLAFALLHHLQDEEALQLFQTASDVLRPGGRLVTYDPAYVVGQHPLARWIISNDRGRAVRNPDGYRNLASQKFAEIEAHVLHDSLTVPYTHYIMQCRKSD